MIEFVKRSLAYLGATLTFVLGLKATVGLGSTRVLVAVSAVSAIACIAFAWIEVYRGSHEAFGQRRADRGEGSVALAVSRAIADVRIAPRDDESIALQANKIVRRGLDKRCVAYSEYKKWRRKNPLIFTAIISSDGQLVGFFDVFPLAAKAAQELIDGTIDEHGLTIEAVLPHEENEAATRIYTASVMMNTRQTAYSTIVAKEVVLLKLAEFVTTVFPPAKDRMVFAYAHTAAGERLLKNSEFTNTALSPDTKQHDPLYELSADGYMNLSRRFQSLLEAHLGRHATVGAPDITS